MDTVVRTGLSLWCAGVLTAGFLWGVARIPVAPVKALGPALAGSLPPGPFLLPVLARSAGSFLLLAILLLAWHSSGREVRRWIAGPGRGTGPYPAAIFLGYGTLSLALLGAGAVGLWFPGVLGAMLGLGLLPGVRAFGRTARDAVATARSLWSALPPGGRMTLIGLAAVWIPFLSLPETHIDAMSCHLAFPEQILERHRIFAVTAISWAKPHFGDLPYAFPVMLGLDPAARQIGFVLAAAGCFTFLTSLPARLPAFAGLLAAALALLCPGGRAILTVAKDDAVMAGFALAGAGAVLATGALAGRRPASAGLVLAGLLLGGAFISKFLVLPFAAALALAVLLAAPAGSRRRTVLLLAAGAAAPVLPWAVKSWLFVSDPLPPVGSVVLPFLFGDPVVNIRAARVLSQMTGIVEHRPLASAPVETALLLARNGFMFLAAVPVLVAWRRRGIAVFLFATLAAFAAMVVGIRAGLAHVERYVYPLSAALNLVGAAALAEHCAAAIRNGLSPLLRRAVETGAAVLAVAALLVFHAQVRLPPRWDDSGKIARSAGYLTGRVSHAEYDRAARASAGELLPAMRGARGGTILPLHEEFLYGLPRCHMASRDLKPPLVWAMVAGADTPERLAVKFRQRGFSRVLYNSEVAAWERNIRSPYRWTPRMLKVYAGFAARHLTLTASAPCAGPGFGSSWLFSVGPRPSPGPVLFLPGAENAFHDPVMARARGDCAAAIEEFSRLGRLLPEVVEIRGMLAHTLVRCGRYAEAYPHARAAAEAGIVGCFRPALVDWAVAAGRTGRKREAERLLERVAAEHPRWPGIAEAARRLAGL